MSFNEWREKMRDTPAGGEVVLSLQGAHIDTKTHQCYSTVALFCQNPCRCALQALTCTNITLSSVYSLFSRKKLFVVAILVQHQCRPNKFLSLSQFPLPFMFFLLVLCNSNHLIWLITDRACDLTSKPHEHHWPSVLHVSE